MPPSRAAMSRAMMSIVKVGMRNLFLVKKECLL